MVDADGLHEPKGHATATNRQIWLSNGAGSGAFSNTITNCHAQIEITDNTTAKAMTAAADAALSTNTDYTKLTGAAFPWTAKYTSNITFSTDKLIVPFAGYYIVSFWGSFLIDVVNTFIGIKYAINDTTPYSVQKLITQAATANYIKLLSATFMVGPLNANDSLSLYLASTKAANVTMKDGGFMVAYLHA